MGKMNYVTLTGRISTDLELKDLGEGKVCNFNIAVNRTFKNSLGTYDTDFIRCVVFNKTAERLVEYVKKGDLIGLNGRLQISSYEKDGEKRSSYEVVVNDLYFLTPKGNKDEE